MESSCTVCRVTQKRTLSWKVVPLQTFSHKNKHFHGKELHCNSSYTKINTLMERSCTVNLVTLKTNTFIERICTIRRVAQKQTLSWKVVAL